jgi:amidase
MAKKNSSLGFQNSIGGVRTPTIEELRGIAEEYNMHLESKELEVFAQAITDSLASYRRVWDLPEPKRDIKYPRAAGYRPSGDENPLNAWYWRCSIKGASEGKLAGKKIAIKDNVCIAGIPLMNGSRILEGFIPDIDATIVTRMLDAGAEIIGKAVCENLCFSGGSHTSATGPVRNPHNLRYSAGGSSSGSAALVANGDCDIATGGDQGGSIRIPSALCGVYGLKPTYGLVPYTGIFPLENTLDHTGPIAKSVEDLALLLEVIAGKDPSDPRQPDFIKPISYAKALTTDIKGLKFGIVQEGFGWSSAQSDTDLAVKEASHCFEKAGGKVREVSIPLHRDGMHIWAVICNDGGFQQVVRGHGFGMGWKGYYPTSAIDFFGKATTELADHLPDTVKGFILLGHYMVTQYRGVHYAKAQNLVPVLCRAYDGALKDFDILIMPTTAPAGNALPLPDDNPTRKEYFDAAWSYHLNTCAFDVTGHPAMNVPCAKCNGLPVGMMLIGRKFEDETVIRAAHAFESLGLYR